MLSVFPLRNRKVHPYCGTIRATIVAERMAGDQYQDLGPQTLCNLDSASAWRTKTGALVCRAPLLRSTGL